MLSVFDLGTCGTWWMSYQSYLDTSCTNWTLYNYELDKKYRTMWMLSDMDTWFCTKWISVASVLDTYGRRWTLCLVRTRVYKMNVSDLGVCGTRWMRCLTETRVAQGNLCVWPKHVLHKVTFVSDLQHMLCRCVVSDLDTCGTRWMLCLTYVYTPTK